MKFLKNPPNPLPSNGMFRVDKKFSKSFLIPWIIGALAFVILQLLSEWFIDYKSEKIELSQRMDTLTFVSTLRSRVERELNTLIYLSSGVSGYIKAHQGKLNATEIHTILSEIHGNIPMLRNLGIAIGTKLQYIVPIEGNEEARGLDYRSLPNQWPAIEKTIQTRRGTLTGPVNLVQGGQGLIFRNPIFINNKYWGLLSTVVDIDNLFQSAFKRIDGQRFVFSIRNADPKCNPCAIYGDISLFEKPDTLVVKAEVPNNVWEYGIRDTAVNQQNDLFYSIRVISLILSLVLIIILIYTYHTWALSRRSGKFYQLVTENISDIIWVYNINKNKFTYVSPSVEQLRGFTPQQAMDQSLEQSLTPKSYEKMNKLIPKRLEHFLTFLDKSKVYYDELRQICKDGSTIWVETVTKYQYNQNNDVEIIGITRNINQRKLNDRELRKLSTAVEQSPVSIVITDISGHIQYVNPSFTKITGYTLEEAQGKNPRILKTNLTNRNTYTQLWETILKGNIWQGEFINRKKNGDTYYEEAIIAPIHDDDKKIINFIAIKEDITIRKTQELAIEEYMEKLRELNATKDKFFNIIAHDLRNSFNVLIGLSNLIKDEMDSLKPDERARTIQSLHNSTHGAYRLLENLLTWSRSQTGTMAFQPQTIQWSNIANEMINLFQSALDAKQIQFVHHAEPFLSFYADHNMVATILRNLISNAIKFTPREGVINLQAKLTDNIIQVTVKDSGLGMTEEISRQIFQLDHNHTTLGTENEKGTGLGLILCREFVEKNGGTIKVNSKPGQGSSFTFSLPAAADQCESEIIDIKNQTDHLLESPGNRKTLTPLSILIIDDDEISCLILRKILTQMGHTAKVAHSGEEAFEMIKKSDYDIIFTDIHLPKLDGLETSKRILTRIKHRPVIIAMSGEEIDSHALTRYFSAGIQDTLPKPISTQTITQLLDKYSPHSR